MGKLFALLSLVAVVCGYPLKEHSVIIGEFYANVSSELVSIAMTILIVDQIYERRSKKEKYDSLLLQLQSPSNLFSIEAVRILRDTNALIDGTMAGVKINNAKLRNANLSHADFRNAELMHGDFSGVNFEKAQLRNAQLMGSKFDCGDKPQDQDVTNIRTRSFECIFASANLENANFMFASARNAIFWHANLRNATLRSSDFEGATCHGADFRGCDPD